MVDGEGIRSYLVSKSDTDGDGMPDGYEAYMCLRIGGFDVFAQRYQCNDFDHSTPTLRKIRTWTALMSIEMNYESNEWYTSSEEYIHGAPANHTTELDGLWCTATLPEGALVTNWPHIPTGVNATFQNLLPVVRTQNRQLVKTCGWGLTHY